MRKAGKSFSVRCRAFLSIQISTYIAMPCRRQSLVSCVLHVQSKITLLQPFSALFDDQGFAQSVCSVWTGRRWKMQLKSETKRVNLMICTTPWAKNPLWHIWMLSLEHVFWMWWDDFTFPLPITSRWIKPFYMFSKSQKPTAQLLKPLKMQVLRSDITMIMGSVHELSKSIGSRVPCVQLAIICWFCMKSLTMKGRKFALNSCSLQFGTSKLSMERMKQATLETFC